MITIPTANLERGLDARAPSNRHLDGIMIEVDGNIGSRFSSVRSNVYQSIVPSLSNSGNVKLVVSPGSAAGYPILIDIS